MKPCCMLPHVAMRVYKVNFFLVVWLAGQHLQESSRLKLPLKDLVSSITATDLDSDRVMSIHL